MNQELVAGLGNMLTDEVLWRAKIHPCRVFTDLEQRERRSPLRSSDGAHSPDVDRALEVHAKVAELAASRG